MIDQAKVEMWNGALDYLKKSRIAWWNTDYVEFLIEKVWKITAPVSIVDFGCGIGFLGELMLPYLPEGCHYTGIDIGDKLLREAEKNFSQTPYSTSFIHADLCSFTPEKKYDIAICQAVLQHIPDPLSILEKMRDSVKPGGLVICLDVSRDTDSASLFVDGMDYGKMNILGVEQKLRRGVLDTSQKDFEIGLKLPVYMQKAGLKNIDIRMNDFVQFVNPESESYPREYESFTSGAYDTAFTDDMKDGFTRNVTRNGLTLEEAEKLFCCHKDRNEYIQKNRDKLFAVSSRCMFIAYGNV